MSPRGKPREIEPREWVLKHRCSRCGVVKPWADFSPAAYHDDGSVRFVQSSCKSCRAVSTAEWNRRKRAAIKKDRDGKGERLSGEPFRVWLQGQLDSGVLLADLADRSGVWERSLRRVLTGEHKNVTLDIVDRCLTACDGSLDDLYPLDEELAA